MPATPLVASLRNWLRPPRHLLVIFLATTSAFLVGLIWLGWQSIVQDRNLETQRVRDRLENTTDAISAELRRNLADVQTQLDRFAAAQPGASLIEALAGYSVRLTNDALLVTFDKQNVQAYPRQRLLYYPTLPAAEEPYIHTVAPARAYAQAAADPRTAVELFQVLAQNDDEAVRAEALLSLAAAQRALGRTSAALETYSLLRQPEILVAGRPAELLARLERAEMLAGLDETRFAEEVGQLFRDLHGGRWKLTRPSYEYYAEQVGRLVERSGTAPGNEAPSAAAASLAEGVQLLWGQWQRAAADEMADGAATRWFDDQPVFLVWRATSERLVALVAGPAFLDDRIIGPLRGVLDRQGVEVVLEDGEGRRVLAHGTTGPNAQRALRTITEAGLPWSLRVVGATGDVDRVQFSTRLRVMIAGLALLALVVVGGSYLGVRAVSREIEAVRLKSDFVAAVSHEFRTPLTLLRQFSDLLADGRVSSEQERRRYYAALQRGTRRLTRLVEDLLDFGRMEAGSRAFVMQPVPARAWLAGLTSEFQEEIQSKGYVVEFTWTGPDVIVHADEAAIGRALWNLLDNAVKYSPACKTIWVKGQAEGDNLVVDVRDRGLGVSSDEQRAIFGKFVRGAATAGMHVKGTGLGLALVTQIVEAHGGEVRVDSVVGEGSTFSMTLPANAVPRKEPLKWRAS